MNTSLSTSNPTAPEARIRPPTGRIGIRALPFFAVIAMAFTLLHPSAAEAAPLRQTSLVITCPSTPLVAGNVNTCVATVNDTALGTRSLPLGSVNFSSSNSKLAAIPGPCVLVQSRPSSTSCQVRVVGLGGGSGQLNATYAPNDGVHQVSTGKMGITTQPASGPGIVTSSSATGVTSLAAAPVIDLGVGHVGDLTSAYIVGCSTANGGGYWGEFASYGAGTDPLVDPYGKPFEDRTADDGGGSVQGNIPADTVRGEWHGRWYCASASPASPDDPAITWMSPLYSFTIADPSPA